MCAPLKIQEKKIQSCFVSYLFFPIKSFKQTEKKKVKSVTINPVYLPPRFHDYQDSASFFFHFFSIIVAVF